MAKLEDLTRGAAVKGILPDCLVTVVDVKWYGSAAIELTYKDPSGKPSVVLLYRDREPTLEIGETGRPWSFDGDGKLFRLVSEAHRINLAHLFDPLLAIHTSMVDPLPHQITAVYGEMLPRQPLRFLLADDPGAGKTIMAGLLIKELLIRGEQMRPLSDAMLISADAPLSEFLKICHHDSFRLVDAPKQTTMNRGSGKSAHTQLHFLSLDGRGRNA